MYVYLIESTTSYIVGTLCDSSFDLMKAARANLSKAAASSVTTSSFRTGPMTGCFAAMQMQSLIPGKEEATLSTSRG